MFVVHGAVKGNADMRWFHCVPLSFWSEELLGDAAAVLLDGCSLPGGAKLLYVL